MATQKDTAQTRCNPLTPWTDLEVKLSESTIESVASLGFDGMTAVQAATIPLMLSNKDVAVEAVTGSGKTLAFVIPVVETLLQKVAGLGRHGVGAVVVSPTRELAAQIAKVFAHFVRNTAITLGCFTGGRDAEREEQQYSLHGAHIIVATPGHLREVLGQRQSPLAGGVRSLEVLVLDEADRLLDMGFSECVSHILSYLPKQRRTGLFSATQTRQLKDLVRAGLRNPVFVRVQETQAAVDLRMPAQLQNLYTVVPAEEKLAYLVDFLRVHKGDKVMVFFATCAVVDYMCCVLDELVAGVEFVALHGKMKSKRQAVFAQFMQLQRGVLLCTDVMARGVDFPSVSWVVQYDPPTTASGFVHRCGRTARMGRGGQALLLLQPHEEAYVEFLQLNQQVQLQSMPPRQPCSTDTLVSKVRRMASKDRALYEKGIRAFVSFVQSYSKHECGLLFQVKELKVGELAEGMGLLRIPAMPELRGIPVTGFSVTDLDLDSIRYKDKQRERQRQEKMARQKTDDSKMAAAGETAKVQSKKAVKGRGKEPVKGRGKEPVKRRGWDHVRGRGKHGSRPQDADELEELAEGARLLKKFKAGKISKSEFEERLENL